MARVEQLKEQGEEIEVDWVPGYRRVEGNERADMTVKGATEMKYT